MKTHIMYDQILKWVIKYTILEHFTIINKTILSWTLANITFHCVNDISNHHLLRWYLELIS